MSGPSKGSGPSDPNKFKDKDWMEQMTHESPAKKTKTQENSGSNNDATNANLGAKRFVGEFFVPDNNDVTQKYEKKDDNTYRVNVIMIDESKKISRMRMAQILLKLNVTNVIDVKSLSRNKLCIYFNNHEMANKFSDFDLTIYNLRAEIPVHYVTVVGVLRDIPLDMNMETLYGMIDSSEKVVKVERIYRKARKEVDLNTTFRGTERNQPEFEPTYSVKLTFKKSILPKDIQTMFYRERVHPFMGVTRQCQNCLRFGHTKFQCKSKVRCEYCGENHPGNTCDKLNAAFNPICLHCKGPHRTTSFSCLERARQNNIKILMASNNLNYKEVIEEFPTYASPNSFNLLARQDEFPTLTRANYSSVLKNHKRAKIIMSTRLSPVKVINPDRNKFNQQYQEISYKDVVTKPITENPHKTSELERIHHSLQTQEQQHQQIYSNQTTGITAQLSPSQSNQFYSETQQSTLNVNIDKTADYDMDT
jgi:hypothetical protein